MVGEAESLTEAFGPRSIGELIDGGYQALRAYPRVLLGCAAVFLVPLTLVVALLGQGKLNPGLVTPGAAPAGIVGVAGYSLATLLMGLPLANATMAAALGERPTLRAAFRLPARVWLAAPLSWLVVAGAKLAGAALFGFPFFAVVALSLPLAPVLAIERLGPFAAVGRAWRLSGRTFGRNLAVVLVNGLTTAVIGGALLVPILAIAAVPDGPRRPLATLGQLIVGLIITPTAATSAALCYLDQRARVEALDLGHALNLRRMRARRPSMGAGARAGR